MGVSQSRMVDVGVGGRLRRAAAHARRIARSVSNHALLSRIGSTLSSRSIVLFAPSPAHGELLLLLARAVMRIVALHRFPNNKSNDFFYLVRAQSGPFGSPSCLAPACLRVAANCQ